MIQDVAAPDTVRYGADDFVRRDSGLYAPQPDEMYATNPTARQDGAIDTRVPDDGQRSPDPARQLTPGPTLLRTDVEPGREPEATVPRPRLPDPINPEKPEQIAQAPRPPGSYPRQIAHDEVVEAHLDPETGNVSTKVVDKSEPIVTAWDRSAPTTTERPVGSWAVSPTTRDIEVAEGADARLPDEVQKQLQAIAQQNGGEPVQVTIRLSHDLDTDETTATAYVSPRQKKTQPVESPNGSLPGISTHDEEGKAAKWGRGLAARDAVVAGVDDGSSELSETLKAYAEIVKQQQAQRGGKGRRAGRGDKLKDGGYQLPTIVVKESPVGDGGRIGGL